MPVPKTIIFANGGSHGDFVRHSCLFVTENVNFFLQNTGRTKTNGEFRHQLHLPRIFFMPDDPRYNDLKDYEMSHVWYEDFIDYPSKFFYINYNEKITSIILEMWLKKANNNDKNIAINESMTAQFLESLPSNIEKKINKDNFDQVFSILWKRQLKLFSKQPGIQKIELLDLYDHAKFCAILENITGVKDLQNNTAYKGVYDKWLSINRENITKIYQALQK